jgi:hypothetical protein
MGSVIMHRLSEAIGGGQVRDPIRVGHGINIVPLHVREELRSCSLCIHVNITYKGESSRSLCIHVNIIYKGESSPLRVSIVHS